MRTLRRMFTRAAKAPQWIRLFLTAASQSKQPEYAVTSMDLCDMPGLRAILGQKPDFFSRLLNNYPRTVIGWGRKWSGQRATELARTTGSRLLLLEDGFVRSFARSDPSCAIIVDDMGVFYDASAPSAIERYAENPLTAEETARIEDLLKLWRSNEISKYNHAPEYGAALPQPYILVVDQVRDDLSISFGGADAATFNQMLAAARREHPDKVIVLKVHPDVYNHARKGHFDIEALQRDEQVLVISENCHPVRLIRNAAAVYTVTSQMGFEALIWGKPVRCFGMPFYAGYGLTQDEQTAPERRKPVSLHQLAHSALCKCSRYYNPQTGAESDAETIINLIGLQRRSMTKTPNEVFALGFSKWKRPHLAGFMPGTKITFTRDASAIPEGATVAVWGSRNTDGLPPGTTTLRVEDGFLRSSGLGADLTAPLSWVIDDQGIYYDSRAPSRLETILQQNDFGPAERDRASRLADVIKKNAISKYNLGGRQWARPANAKHVILVPGQVEADASIRCGAPQIARNLDLLRAVRSRNPFAYIVYKPHPDIVAGLRKGGIADIAARNLCDDVLEDVDICSLWGQINAVHTMTSLTGFEALLRGVDVTCYGQPFYAGWGLTHDINPVPRRTATLTLDALVAGTLIAYPRYISRRDRRPTSPEQAIEDLGNWREKGDANTRLWRSGLRTILKAWAKSGLRRNA